MQRAQAAPRTGARQPYEFKKQNLTLRILLN